VPERKLFCESLSSEVNFVKMEILHLYPLGFELLSDEAGAFGLMGLPLIHPPYDKFGIISVAKLTKAYNNPINDILISNLPFLKLLLKKMLDLFLTPGTEGYESQRRLEEFLVEILH